MLDKLIAVITALIISLFSFPQPTSVPVFPTPTHFPSPTPIVKRQLVKLNAPFTSQAPNYDWKDLRLQDGCEEATILMAYYWAKDKKLNSEIALKEIFSMSEYQSAHYSEYRDTSLVDTAERLLKGHYSYENFLITNNVSLQQIISALYEKHLVILPMNGKLLHNPNYTGAGPDRHMLLLIGYDPETKEFISNDAGTWRGQNYRYPQDTVYSAIRDYITGYHIPIPDIRKNMLEVF